MFATERKTAFSGIQPSGDFTIGNYFGAIRNWKKLQEDFNSIFCVVDLHAITVSQNPASLRKHTFESAAMVLAAGIDPGRSLLFLQSGVGAHSELTWILNCFAYMGELSRMTQFKDKSAKFASGDAIKVGLFDYPVLMAADILLYQADVVPVGDDQRQHIELTRDIAQRFNQQFSQTFTVPEGYYGKEGTRIMSLQNPEKKMSKSDENINSFVLMKDPKDKIIAKFKRAVTDSENSITFDKKNKPGISNLLEIYSCSTGKPIKDCEKEFENFGYGEFKVAVGEAVSDRLTPIQNEFERLLKEKDYINAVLKEGSEKAAGIAAKTLGKVKKKVGFYII